MTRGAALVVLGACASPPPVVEPVVDVPQNDSASAFPLDQLTMSIAHEGSTVDLASASFTHGQTPELRGIPFGDDLVMHLTGFVGTGEFAYGRTCSFAIAAGGPVPQPHLFFSREVKFATLAAMPELRRNGNAITYHDGSGLFVGGVDASGTAVPDVERFDPRTGELRPLATVAPRVGDIAATVGTGSDAQIALIGGLDPTTGTGASFVELLEADGPPQRRVQMLPDGNMSRVGLTATTLTDGRVIAIGGMMPPSGPPAADVDEVTLANGSAEVRPLHAMLQHPRYGHTATRLGDDIGAGVLIAGGLDGTGAPVPEAELFKPLSETFSPAVFSMVVPRSQHRAVRMPDGSVLIIGGVDQMGNPVATLELFTLDAGFVAIGQLPAGAGVVDFTATTLPDGRVLLTGGRLVPNGPPTSAAFIARLDPINGSVDVLPTDHLSAARAGHQATLLCDGTVMLTGGTDTPAVLERYNPPALGRR